MIEVVSEPLNIINDDTEIILSHGDIAAKSDFIGYLDMLIETRDNVKKLMDEGLSLDEITAGKANVKYDEAAGDGFINPNFYIQTIWNSYRL